MTSCFKPCSFNINNNDKCSSDPMLSIPAGSANVIAQVIQATGMTVSVPGPT